MAISMEETDVIDFHFTADEWPGPCQRLSSAHISFTLLFRHYPGLVSNVA